MMVVQQVHPSIRIPWVEDTEWNDEQEAKAETVLRENLERCRIRADDAHNSSSESAWNRFYEQHQTNFFKDRHWPAAAFPEEFSTDTGVLCEVGCGVGNTLLPLLNDHHSNWTVLGLDLSPTAIAVLQQDARFQRFTTRGQASCFVADISQPNSLPPSVQSVATVTSLFFCLSAIDPNNHEIAVRNAASTLRRRRGSHHQQQQQSSSAVSGGGVLVFRDYGRYDEAQLKLGRQRHKLLDDNFYRKNDGTCCYYFTVERVRELFAGTCGLEELECGYIRRVYTNRSEQTQRRRVWVQARFRIPSCAVDDDDVNA